MDLNKMLTQIKSHPHISRAGMILCHNGVVRATSRDGRSVTGLAVEVDHQRLADCLIDLALFTNLTQDQLDYHQDMARYWAVKQRLFTDLLTQGPKASNAAAILNCSHAKGRALLARMKRRGRPADDQGQGQQRGHGAGISHILQHTLRNPSDGNGGERGLGRRFP